MRPVKNKAKGRTGRDVSGSDKLAGRMMVAAKMSENDIRELAYAFFKARGCVNGNDLGDWFLAEKTITEKVSENG